MIKYIFGFFGIGCATFLEILAIRKGINGKCLSIFIGLIGLIMGLVFEVDVAAWLSAIFK